MLVTPQPMIDSENHVLLSSLDETVIQRESEFNLGIHKYPGNLYNPKGHKYIRDFVTDPIPKLTYRVGGVILTKEMIFSTLESRMIIKYTLVEANSPTKLRLRPFLAFRNIHTLSRENIFADKKYEEVKNGVKIRMYQGYTDLYLQVSKVCEYTHVPDWYYNIEYQEEMDRGYEYQEDLYNPGFLEFDIRRGESVFFSASTAEINPLSMKRAFSAELSKRIPRDNFVHCLVNAAQQFIIRNGKSTEVKAGFPWYGQRGRDTFISLPGLTLVQGDHKACQAVLETMVSGMNGPFFSSFSSGSQVPCQSADTSLWFFWTLQQYDAFTGSGKKIWKDYGRRMKTILESYRDGTGLNIHMDQDGLISAGLPGKAVTWMDAVSYGKPVTPRTGNSVEVNALWYNAIMYAIEVSRLAGDSAFEDEWKELAAKIPAAFLEKFWNGEKRYLADFVDDQYKDWTVRPNMIFVASLPYSPVDEEIRKEVLSRVKQELLTPRGLRTLSPKSPVYKGNYLGNSPERDLAYHQGTVWPWLLGHFTEGYLKIHGKSGLSYVRDIFQGFEAVMTEHGIGTISEIYDGDPPFTARGAISYAMSVAELLRMNYLINKYEL
jgi:predicted glycogen debranching enzyme